jgi:cytochrome bd-type quinol oxidase subunit 1
MLLPFRATMILHVVFFLLVVVAAVVVAAVSFFSWTRRQRWWRRRSEALEVGMASLEAAAAVFCLLLAAGAGEELPS